MGLLKATGVVVTSIPPGLGQHIREFFFDTTTLLPIGMRLSMVVPTIPPFMLSLSTII